MFRNLIAAAGLGLGVLGAVPTQAMAADVPPARSHHTTYELWYQAGHDHGWRLYGTYPSHDAARHAADGLRHHGYRVRIDPH